jgi:hypothetical protein
MFAGRPFIVPRQPSQSTPQSTSEDPAHSPARTNTSVTTNLQSFLAADCVDAAMSVIDTCQVLRNTIGLARGSYTEFSACRASLLIIITQCLEKKTKVLSEVLRHGMEMIKEMAAGGESARSEVSLIEAFERAIARLVAAGNVAQTARRSDYSNFKQWEMLWKYGPQTHELGSNLSWSGSMALPVHMGGISQTAAWSTGDEANVAPMAVGLFGVDPSHQSLVQPADELSFLFEYGFGSNTDHTVASGGT